MDSLFYKKNLLSVYSRASPEVIEQGLYWYKNVNTFVNQLASQYNVHPYVVASVISCLSPASKWERNLVDARNVIEGYYHRGFIGVKGITVATYGLNKQKACDILLGNKNLDESTGLKTFNFANNIYNPLNKSFVTIDRHAWRILQGNHLNIKDININRKNYEIAKNVYIDVASQVDLIPCELQAITWVQWKKENG